MPIRTISLNHIRAAYPVHAYSVSLTSSSTAITRSTDTDSVPIHWISALHGTDADASIGVTLNVTAFPEDVFGNISASIHAVSQDSSIPQPIMLLELLWALWCAAGCSPGLYCRHCLLSACTYSSRRQESMLLTGYWCHRSEWLPSFVTPGHWFLGVNDSWSVTPRCGWLPEHFCLGMNDPPECEWLPWVTHA